MKSTITVQNKSEFFVPTISRTANTFANPLLYNTQKRKQEGYETRLYYEFLETQKKHGFTVMVTLTYNDKNIPKFHGFNCIDTSDIRYLTHDTRFFKDLESTHGYSFKYFVGAEFGEGGETHNYQGVRGIGNNPHYHVIFFFTPLEDYYSIDKETGEVCTKPHLTPPEVCRAIKHYWQGNTDDCQEYNKGIVNFGSVDPFGVVKDFRGISYVAKYCVKDKYFKDLEGKLKDKMYHQYRKEAEEKFAGTSLDDTIRIQSYVKEKQDELIKEFRNRWSYRVMCSHGVGLSALKEVNDIHNPSVPIPTKKGMANRPLPLYLYRKLYYEVGKTADGKPFYKLNDCGKDYRMFKLAMDIDESEKNTRKNLQTLAQNHKYFTDYLGSKDQHCDCPFISSQNYDSKVFINKALRLIRTLILQNTNNTNNLFYRYAIYTKIYKNRFGEFANPFGDYPILDIEHDYKRTLKDTHKPWYHCSVYDNSIYKEELFSYDSHPYFSSDLDLFRFLDDVNSFISVQIDRKARSDNEQHKRLKKIEQAMKFASA